MSNIPVCEDLATKAELQELRDQINQLLGRTSNGSSNPINVLEQGNLQGTFIADSLIDDIEIEVNQSSGELKAYFIGREPGFNPIKALKNGATATFDAYRQGVKTSFNLARFGLRYTLSEDTRTSFNEQFFKDVTDYIDNNELARRLEVGARNSLKRSKGFFEALEASNSNIIKAKETIDDYLKEIEENKQKIEELRNKAQNKKNEIQELKDDDFMQRDAIGKLFADIEILTEAINQNTLLDDADKQATVDSFAITNFRLSLTEESITAFEGDIERLREKLNDTDIDLENVIKDFVEIEKEQEELDLRLTEVEKVIEEEAQTEEEKQLKITDLIRRNYRSGGGGTSKGAQQGIIDSQKKIVELLNNLVDGNVVYDPTFFEIVNEENQFEEAVNPLIAKLPDITTLPEKIEELDKKIEDQKKTPMTPEEIEDLSESVSNKVDTNLGEKLSGIIAAEITGKLTTITNQTSPQNIGQTMDNVICEQAQNPNSCLNTNITNPIKKLISDVGDNLGSLIAAINTFLNNVILDKLNLMQNFAEKAWNSTIVDKTLNAINTVLCLHNAMMLSRNLGESIGEAANATLQLLNIKSPDGESIDVNEIVGTKLESLWKGLVGVENAEAINATFASLNRILVAGQGVLSAIHGIKDALQNGQEIISQRVSYIGNSFLAQGLVEERSYPWMNPFENFRNPFQGFLLKIQGLNEITDEINELVQSGLEIKEGINEIKEQTEDFKTGRQELEAAMAAFDGDREKIEKDSIEPDSASPDIENLDLVEGEVE